MLGTCQFFSSEKGYGLIDSQAGSFYFPMSQCGGHRIKVGQRVSFCIKLDKRKGPIALQVCPVGAAPPAKPPAPAVALISNEVSDVSDIEDYFMNAPELLLDPEE
jgi:cold shock CspA family protein